MRDMDMSHAQACGEKRPLTTAVEEVQQEPSGTFPASGSGRATTPTGQTLRRVCVCLLLGMPTAVAVLVRGAGY